MMFSMRALAGVVVGVALLGATQANAAFTQIDTPDAAYTTSTIKLLPPPATADGDAVSSLLDSNLTVTFGPAAAKLTAGVTWASWGLPPDAEEDYLSSLDGFPVFYT